MKTITHKLSITFFLTAYALSAAAAPAPEKQLQVDPARTRIEFTLGDILHTVHGTFKLKRADMTFDPTTGHAGGELVVDATSGDSGSGARDRGMHKNVLESDRYPEIVFKPDSVVGAVAPQGQSQVQLHGMFTIHGAAHELTMALTVDASEGQYNATAKFQVPYVKWGMKNPSTLFLRVNQEVDIVIHTVATYAK